MGFLRALSLLLVTPLFLSLSVTTSIRAAAQTAPSDGAAIFKAKCAMCHGADGAGKTPMGQKLNIGDLRSEAVQKRSDSELAHSIAEGKGKMPGFNNKFSPDDIEAVVKQIREFGKQKK